MTKSRKVRSDIQVGNLEKKLGLEPGAIRNPDGSDARSNKKLATLRKEYSQAKSAKIKTNPSISSKSIAKAAKAVSALSNISGKIVKKTSPTKIKVPSASTTKTPRISTKPVTKKGADVKKSTVKKSQGKAKIKKATSKK
ncbi:hypothetical protein [Pedobacter jamesrossensis]|uniref:Uncharacterized protein n=1 Tax=Pedobacter jamesrossensis TaxID=1908238 RepID=A0ABV8NF50_9SPHI